MAWGLILGPPGNSSKRSRDRTMTFFDCGWATIESCTRSSMESTSCLSTASSIEGISRSGYAGRASGPSRPATNNARHT